MCRISDLWQQPWYPWSISKYPYWRRCRNPVDQGRWLIEIESEVWHMSNTLQDYDATNNIIYANNIKEGRVSHPDNAVITSFICGQYITTRNGVVGSSDVYHPFNILICNVQTRFFIDRDQCTISRNGNQGWALLLCWLIARLTLFALPFPTILLNVTVFSTMKNISSHLFSIL